jgi:hypothetical protein
MDTPTSKTSKDPSRSDQDPSRSDQDPRTKGTKGTKSTKGTSGKKGRWDARLPRPSSTTTLSHGQLGRSNLQVQGGSLKRIRKGTGPSAIAFNNVVVKPSNGYKIIAVISAKMDELQRLIAYSDKQSWFVCSANFCGYRELTDNGSLGRAILWSAIRKEPYWFKLVTDKWYPLLNRIHFGGKIHSGTPESEPAFSKCSEGTLAHTADPYLVANVGGYGHDDGMYLLDSSYYRNNQKKRTPNATRTPQTSHQNNFDSCSTKNIRDADVYQLNDLAVDHWLERVRQKGSLDKDYKMAELICKSRQVLIPMDKSRNQYLLSLRLSNDKYWNKQV